MAPGRRAWSQRGDMTIHARPDDFDPAFQSDNTNDYSDQGESLGFGAGIAGEEAAPKKSGGAKKKAKRKPARKKKAASRSSEEKEESSDGDAPPKKKTRRRRSKKKASSESSDGESDEAPKPAKKASKKKKATRKKAAASDDRDEADSEDSEDGEKKRRRRRGSRGGRRRRKKSATEDGVAVDGIPGDEGDLPELPDDAELVAEGDEGGKKKRRRRRSRKKKSDGEDSEEEVDAKGSKKKGKKKKASKKASKKSGKKEAEKTEEELEAEEEAARVRQILVNAVDPEEKRVAVVEGDRICDLLMTSDSQKSLVNDIYRGRVVNLEPAIGAAFVDFGQGRNGFLHTSDVLAMYGEKGFSLDQLLTSKVDPEEWDDAPAQPSVGEEMDEEEEEEARAREKEKASKKKGKKSSSRRRSRDRSPISDLLKVGDQVVVQITKDAIGDKGPTLTTYISIPGRYLVLMPSMARTGVSRKIPDDKERRRLKRILSSIDTPDDMGVIVRTAGVGKTKKDLARDLDYLLGVWQSFGKRLTKGRGPTALYQESNVAIRTLRDLFGANTKEVVVDDPVVHEELTEFAIKLMPEHTDRIRLHEAERPLFHHYGIEQDFEKVFTRRVELPSGGSIVFDQAEALVAIDVNSGRTRTNSFDFEEIALKTNLEAVPEIARQIRLRDLGGILVCDFIDMMKSSSNRTVERALRNSVADDRARSKMGRISQFGLLEMTRQRLGPGTHKKVFQACPRCRGTGRVRTVQSRAQAILRRLGSALTQKGFTTVEVRAHPEVVDYLHDHLWDYVRALEHRFEKEIKTTSVPDQPEDSVLRYLRADGREVRPGGRRKR